MRKTISMYLLSLLPFISYAQPGTVDTTFHAGLAAGDGWVHAVVALPDDRLVVGGTFVQYDGQPCGRIARLEPDGELDESFGTGIGFDGAVLCITRQTDGRLLIGGRFQTYQGSSMPLVVRLSPNGELDTEFHPDLSDLEGVIGLIEQPDGRILVTGQRNVGAFTALRRLLPDGSLDTSFQAPAFRPSATVLLDDGRILVGSITQDLPMQALQRLLPNGAPDSSFAPGEFGAVGFSWASVHTIHVQQDGTYMVGGHFASYAGAVRQSLARILSDGSLDDGFAPEASAWPGPPIWWTNVGTLLGFDDGGLMVPKFGLNTRLRTDGSLDPDFHRGLGLFHDDPLEANMSASTRQSDGRIILAGTFHSYDNRPYHSIVRLHDCVVGAVCDDGDAATTNDMVAPDCTCIGQLSTSVTPTFPGSLELEQWTDGSGRAVISGHHAGPTGPAELLVQDVLGRVLQVRSLPLPTGTVLIEVAPDTGNAAGVRLITLRTQKGRWTRRMVVP